jgi:hypothetical protein
MFFIIKRYIDNMSIHDLNNLAISKNIGLTQEELKFSYDFIKKNWMNILSNKGLFDIDRYKDRFSEENFIKIKSLYKEMLLKYSNYLK